jgi:hypothetical protein
MVAISGGKPYSRGSVTGDRRFRESAFLFLNDELRRMLGNTSCQILQFTCADCQTLCTWVRVGSHVFPLGGCICNLSQMKERVLKTTEGWESYPPIT